MLAFLRAHENIGTVNVFAVRQKVFYNVTSTQSVAADTKNND
jgi:hypothetical protein